MFATCAIGGIHYGTGRHMWDLSNEGIFKALRVSPFVLNCLLLDTKILPVLVALLCRLLLGHDLRQTFYRRISPACHCH